MCLCMSGRSLVGSGARGSSSAMLVLVPPRVLCCRLVLGGDLVPGPWLSVLSAFGRGLICFAVDDGNQLRCWGVLKFKKPRSRP